MCLFPFLLQAQSWQWANHIGGTGFDDASISYVDAQHNIYLYGEYAIDYGMPQFQGRDCYFGPDTLRGAKYKFYSKIQH